MFRLLLLFLTLTMLPFAGVAEAPVTFADDISGVYTWPEGSSQEDASYVYRYRYPQLTGDSALAMTFNNIYQYEESDALGFECPMTGSDHDPALGQMLVDIHYEIVHQSAEFLSIRINKTVQVGENVSSIVKAHTFTLTGENAGTATSLPYLLGLMDDSETDEWYIERQTAKADACAREMVWALIEQAMRDPELQIYKDLTFEEFEWGFYPEEDFYLDAEGNFVFFVQEGVIAPQAIGPFFFTISMDELLDEI